MKKITSILLGFLLVFGLGIGIQAATIEPGPGINQAPAKYSSWQEMRDYCLQIMSSYWGNSVTDNNGRPTESYGVQNGFSFMNPAQTPKDEQMNSRGLPMQPNRGPFNHCMGW